MAIDKIIYCYIIKVYYKNIYNFKIKKTYEMYNQEKNSL